jgi:hypothetical protein
MHSDPENEVRTMFGLRFSRKGQNESGLLDLKVV